MTTASANVKYRALAKMMPNVLEARLKSVPFHDGTFIPTSASLDPGLAELIYETVSQVGSAEDLGDSTMDFPTVEVNSGEEGYKTWFQGSAFNITWQQRLAERTAGLTGRREARLMVAARRVIEEKMDRFAAVGSTKLGATGFFNNPNVTVINSTFNPWTATASEVRKWLLDINRDMDIASERAYSNGRKLMEGNSTDTSNLLGVELIIPPELHYRFDEVLFPQSERTLLERLQSSGSRINRIRSTDYCTASKLQRIGNIGNGTRHRLAMYIPDQEFLEREYSIPEMMPEEYVTVKGQTMTYPMYSLCTQTMIHHPGTIRYVDFVTQ